METTTILQNQVLNAHADPEFPADQALATSRTGVQMEESFPKQALAVADQANSVSLPQAGQARQPAAHLQHCTAIPEQLPPTEKPDCRLGFLLSPP